MWGVLSNLDRRASGGDAHGQGGPRQKLGAGEKKKKQSKGGGAFAEGSGKRPRASEYLPRIKIICGHRKPVRRGKKNRIQRGFMRDTISRGTVFEGTCWAACEHGDGGGIKLTRSGIGDAEHTRRGRGNGDVKKKAARNAGLGKSKRPRKKKSGSEKGRDSSRRPKVPQERR